MGIAGSDDGPAAAHPTQRGRGFKTEFPSLGGDQIGNLMSFEVAPHILDRVEFRRISRQPFNHDAPLGGGYIVFDQHTPMDRCAIPDNQHFPGDMSLEVAQKLDDLETFNTTSMNLEIEPPERQATDDRKAFPVEGFVQHWGLPTRSPSARAGGPGAQAAFVDEHYGSSLLAGLFFKAGNSVRDQRRIAFSSRSTARRSGRWQLKPLAPSKRQTCPG